MEYYINHKFSDIVLIPLLGITPNFPWLALSHKEKLDTRVVTRDNIKAKVIDYEERPIVEFESLIQERYKVHAWDFLKKWVEREPMISSIVFLKLTLTKEEEWRLDEE